MGKSLRNQACQIVGGHFHGKKSACGKTSQQHRASQILGGHFHREKAPAARLPSSTGLVKSWVAIFTEKKAPAARLPSGNSACEILDGHFHREKAPAAGLPSSNRACQVRAKVRSAPKTSNLARTGSRIIGLGRKSVQMDRTGCPDPSRPLPGLRTASQTQFSLPGTEVQGD